MRVVTRNWFGWTHKLVLPVLSWVVQGTLSQPQSEISSLRSLLVRGALPARYMGRMAAFGNPLDGSDGNDMTRTYSLVLPPDDPWLCEYPKSFKLLTENETELIRVNEELWFPTPVAFLVSINLCSAETKARVALEIKKKLALPLELLIIYSSDPNSNQVIQLQPDNSKSNTDYLNTIALMHIPYRYAAGIDMRMKITRNGEEPTFLQGDNQKWSFPVQITNYTGSYDNDDRFSTGSTRDGDYHDTDRDIYWFRIILFSILVLSPCCRACYLWYAGGGRFYFRRNQRGWIVGLQYVPPAPAWLASGGGGRTPTAAGGRRRQGTLTEEQFNQLPEIEYQPIASHYDEDQTHEPQTNTNNNNNNNNNNKADQPKKNLEETGKNHKESDEDEDIDLNEKDDGPKEKLESMEQGQPQENLADQHEGTFDTEEQTNEPSQEDNASPFVSDEVSADQAPKRETAAADGRAAAATASKLERVEEGTADGPLVCRSSMCSICIDEFEANEKIILLPSCQHGFHRDCIHPWLTERQGCCPFCKAPVIEEEATEHDSSELEDAASQTSQRQQGGSSALLAGEGRQSPQQPSNGAGGGEQQPSPPPQEVGEQQTFPRA